MILCLNLYANAIIVVIYSQRNSSPNIVLDVLRDSYNIILILVE